MIRVLPDIVQNKIAAGEVVERPAAAVKELVENAIDAGATRISVEIEEGGMRRIRVADDGCGMTKDDLQLSILRHATSKIHEVEDIFAISTMGFRGEALPSIGSVSRLSISSCTQGQEEGCFAPGDWRQGGGGDSGTTAQRYAGRGRGSLLQYPGAA